MKKINLDNVIYEQMLRDFHDGPPRGSPVKNIKLKVYHTDKWEKKPINITKGPSRMVNVDNKTRGAEVFSNVNTSKESELHITVRLTSGILEGYNGTVNLELPPELQSKLGEKISIYPGKEISEVKDKMTIGTTSGHDISAGESAATATISTSEGEYHGSFTCTVALSGSVIVENTRGRNTEASIAQMVKDAFRNEIVLRDNVAYWDMKGELECKWDLDQSIVWNQ